MATGKLVPHLRDPHRANLDLTELVAILVDREHHLINDPCLTGAQERTGITLGEPPGTALKLEGERGCVSLCVGIR